LIAEQPEQRDARAALEHLRLPGFTGLCAAGTAEVRHKSYSIAKIIDDAL
jgi:hypothetical protein